MEQQAIIEEGERDELSPCLSEPCPCGTFMEFVPIKVRGKETGRQWAVPFDWIEVYNHRTLELIICSLRSRAEVEAVIDERWEFQSNRKCKDSCFGAKHQARHFHFSLPMKHKEQVRRKAHFTLAIGENGRLQPTT